MKIAPGCRRIIIDPGYLQALHRPNVTPTWDPIAKVSSTGIVTSSGTTIPLDVIIYATGFKPLKLLFTLIGSKGISLDEYFAMKGGPEAYLGTTIPGFPNFIMLLGPNTATGHASVIFTEECQINYSLKLLAPVLARAMASFEVRSEVIDNYNAWLQKRLHSTVFTACRSYYHQSGTQSEKIVVIWPGSLTRFWWATLRLKWSEYIVRGGRKWEEERQSRSRYLICWTIFLFSIITMFNAMPSKVRTEKDEPHQ